MANEILYCISLELKYVRRLVIIYLSQGAQNIDKLCPEDNAGHGEKNILLKLLMGDSWGGKVLYIITVVLDCWDSSENWLPFLFVSLLCLEYRRKYVVSKERKNNIKYQSFEEKCSHFLSINYSKLCNKIRR